MPKPKIKRPCSDCPFRWNAKPGWLGADTADNFVRNALADYADHPLPCHLTIDYSDPDWLENQYEEAALCAGALIFCKNNAKTPRDPERAAWVKTVEPDHDLVFTKPWEFYEYHGEEVPEDYARMRRYVLTGKWGNEE